MTLTAIQVCELSEVIRKLNQIKKKHPRAEVYVIADSSVTLEKVYNVSVGYVLKDTSSDTITTAKVFSKSEYLAFENPSDYKLIVVIG